MPEETPAPAPEEVPAEAPVVEPTHELGHVGHFVDVVDGPFKGLFGALTHVYEDGTALVAARDHGGFVDVAQVEHAHTRPSLRTGGR